MGTGQVRNADLFDSGEWWDPNGFLFGMHELLNPVRVPFIVEHLRLAQASNTLDVGCGGGFLSEAMARHGVAVTGLDHSENNIAAARRAALSSTRYLVGDAHALPFKSGAFDAVVLSETLEHVDRPGVAFAEATRVLAPEGVLIVTGPNRTLFSRVALIWLAQKWPTGVLPRHLHEYRSFISPRRLAEWCETSGLVPGAMKGIGIPAGSLLAAVTALVRLRRGLITYPEAARAIRLVPNDVPVIAYMATAIKLPVAHRERHRLSPSPRGGAD